jgi:hypothetical protein
VRALRVRFTVSWMMIGVAIVALVLAAEQLAKRRGYLLELAAIHADRANDYVIGCGPCLKEDYYKPSVYNKLHNYEVAMARKYRLAASRPWRTVEPDPLYPIP